MAPTKLILISMLVTLAHTQSKRTQLCRSSCGQIPISYPFGVDDGCGSPYYRRILVCSDSGDLEFRTPSGRYPVLNISYSDPHLLITDPSMWSCRDGDGDAFRPTTAFSLDTSTHFRLSPQNDYLFFNCSHDDVIMEPKPVFCERFPDQCDSACDTASYLCRHLPHCGAALHAASCCSYYPKGSDSLRMMLNHCSTYTTVYWRNLGVTPAYNQVPEYGIRIDFDIPVTTRCLWCQDAAKGAGTCGFDVGTLDFTCLCDKGNATTYCKDRSGQGTSPAMVAGSVSAVSVAGAFVGVGIWYLRKVRAKAPVTHGVQTNENRLF
ncbi:LOW QUALITY PROTEIN: wall-associated receptor kinase 2 [Salvia miltiorrhiza]|uniref:LOW QUALITY PROTEIN: wall-associated receptor kinase 2 n=1 Tax=Salvia miltiorrhiza TaxID=226208 RepID=UPI0025AB7F8F|nr:LOW QUALITY PROTEIN: wall-associated receptor kinase 2 [Salvia miltiorrhiza]